MDITEKAWVEITEKATCLTPLLIMDITENAWVEITEKVTCLTNFVCLDNDRIIVMPDVQCLCHLIIDGYGSLNCPGLATLHTGRPVISALPPHGTVAFLLYTIPIEFDIRIRVPVCAHVSARTVCGKLWPVAASIHQIVQTLNPTAPDQHSHLSVIAITVTNQGQAVSHPVSSHPCPMRSSGVPKFS